MGTAQRRLLQSLLVCGGAYLLLLIPDRDAAPPPAAANGHFNWNRDSVWYRLEANFKAVRTAGCDPSRTAVTRQLQRDDRLLGVLQRPVRPDAPVLDTIELEIFELGPVMAACPQWVPQYTRLVTSVRTAVKRQSEHWDMTARATRDRLYRLLWGGRTALEEVMLQGRPDSIPALTVETDEPSQAPSTRILGVTIHSGDLLVSRGGEPSSALIAVGSDYPGNFSHDAMVYVDPRTSLASVVESNFDHGVNVLSLEDYLRDVKLRVMVLRLRADLPAVQHDPMVPHEAASFALREARGRHIPYDFQIDYQDHTRMYCSELVATSYQPVGITLWAQTSQISDSGTRRWLTELGVTHFATEEPSDLEYDPQLVVVAEWRDPETLFRDHVDNVVTEAMLNRADKGDYLRYSWYLLPVSRMLKLYSLAAQALGFRGPVPPGMSATTALRMAAYNKRHERLRDVVLERAAGFQKREGYRAPEWELLRFARQASDELQ